MPPKKLTDKVWIYGVPIFQGQEFDAEAPKKFATDKVLVCGEREGQGFHAKAPKKVAMIDCHFHDVARVAVRGCGCSSRTCFASGR
jgi:hypothetical protein